MHIMGEMMKTISEPREDYKPHVPRIIQIEIPSEFIGAVIGKGGETIQGLQKETGTTITIEEVETGLGDGSTKGVVDIFGVNKDAMDAALQKIKDICAVPEAGTVYHGKVTSIQDFGAFVEILPGKEGLLHVSEIAWTKTENVSDVLKVGDEVDVKLLEIDQKTGKMRLSMRALTEKPEGYVEPKRNGGPRQNGDRRQGGDRRDNGRGNDRREGRQNGERRDNNRQNGERRHDNRNNEHRENRRPRQEEAPEQNNEPEFF
jgi:polyribonucleotide nucleotidyltransferase